MERQGHSPLPWIVGRDDRVEAANGRVVADMTFSSHSQQRASANAALIVEAVNQHAALVEQRDRLLRLLRPVTSPTACYCAVMKDEKCWHCEARELIAAVEQGGEA